MLDKYSKNIFHIKFTKKKNLIIENNKPKLIMILTEIKPYITSSNLHKTINGLNNERYRNNILFSIGLDENQEIEVGPLLKSGIVTPSSSNKLISFLGINVCKNMKEYIYEYSQLPIYNSYNQRGFWRHLHIRQNSKEEYMITFRFTNFHQYQNIFWDEKHNLISFLQSKIPYNLVQLNYQIIQGKREPTINDTIYQIYFKKHLFEEMLDKTFIIHPLSFFQVNFETAKLMFQKVRELTENNNKSTLLDLCCGVGVYSYLLYDKFEKVIGIDSNPNNIKVAELLSFYNSQENIIFVRNKIENIIPDLVTILDKITIIVNPVRSGLHKNVTKTLKNIMGQVNQIIYISCNPKSLVRDLKLLEVKKENIHDIIPINQFPNTKELELIVNIKIRVNQS